VGSDLTGGRAHRWDKSTIGDVLCTSICQPVISTDYICAGLGQMLMLWVSLGMPSKV